MKSGAILLKLSRTLTQFRFEIHLTHYPPAWKVNHLAQGFNCTRLAKIIKHVTVFASNTMILLAFGQS